MATAVHREFAYSMRAWKYPQHVSVEKRVESIHNVCVDQCGCRRCCCGMLLVMEGLLGASGQHGLEVMHL